MTDQGNPQGDEREPDEFELLMADALGQESELDPEELELLIAAGQEAGDLEAGEFDGLSGLARALDSAGAMDQVALEAVSPEEKEEAAQAWVALVNGDSTDQVPATTELRPVPPAASWWRNPMVAAVAVAALVLAAFLGGQRLGSKDPEPEPGIPDGTLGTDPNAPELAPTLRRGADGNWTIALENTTGEVRASLRDLQLDLEIKGPDGTFAPVPGDAPGPFPQFSPGAVRWTLEGIEAADPSAIRFRIRLEAPAGRPSWRSDWFLGNQVSSTE